MQNQKYEYNPAVIELKWQKYWQEHQFYQALEPSAAGGKKIIFAGGISLSIRRRFACRTCAFLCRDGCGCSQTPYGRRKCFIFLLVGTLLVCLLKIMPLKPVFTQKYHSKISLILLSPNERFRYSLLIGRAKLIPPIPNTTNGHNGYLSNYLKKV